MQNCTRGNRGEIDISILDYIHIVNEILSLNLCNSDLY